MYVHVTIHHPHIPPDGSASAQVDEDGGHLPSSPSNGGGQDGPVDPHPCDREELEDDNCAGADDGDVSDDSHDDLDDRDDRRARSTDAGERPARYDFRSDGVYAATGKRKGEKLSRSALELFRAKFRSILRALEELATDFGPLDLEIALVYVRRMSLINPSFVSGSRFTGAYSKDPECVGLADAMSTVIIAKKYVAEAVETGRRVRAVLNVTQNCNCFFTCARSAGIALGGHLS